MISFFLMKTLMFVFNGVLSLGGIVLLYVGTRVKMDSASFAKVLGAASPNLMQLINVGYLCITIGIFLLLIAFMGCCGSMKENKCLLLMFFVLTLILFIAEVAAAVVVLIFTTSMADIFVEHLEKWAMKSLQGYGNLTDITQSWNTTMGQMNCCGFNNYTDFSGSYFYHVYNKYPSPCCRDNKDCQEAEIDKSKQGCSHAFQVFLRKNGKIVGGVVLGIGALELAALAASLFLFCKIGTFR